MVGQGAKFTLIAKNVSQRTCNRNIGSIPQELQLRLGDTVVWPSDVCSGAYLYDFDQVFTPGYTKSFPIDWNGYRNQGGSAMQPCLAIPDNLPAPGQYELVARLGGLYWRDYRGSHGTGLIDALIAATAAVHRARLVTRNARHFPMLEDLLVPYR